MKFPHYGKPSKQSRKSEKVVQTAQKEQSEHLQRQNLLQKCGENWLVIGKVMARCIFYCVHLAMFPSQRKTSGTALTRSCTSGMEEHRDLQKLVRKSSGKSKLQSKEITTKRKIEQASGNIVRLESQKRSGYEQYVLGKLSKKKFLELKQGLEMKSQH